MIDSLIFLNLALINAISIYSNYLLENTQNDKKMNIPLMVVTVIQLVLLYLPMIVAVTYAVIKVSLYCRGRTGRREYEMLEEEWASYSFSVFKCYVID